jgi:regulator of sirC expression with transglutaminase-like and TPR domain
MAGRYACPLFIAAVTLAAREHPGLDVVRVRGEIERLAVRWRARVARDPTPAGRADAFRAVLFEDGRFEAVRELDTPETLCIDSVLRNRRGYCLSLSLVALLVAERVGAPLHGVAAPNHFLVRYDDGRFRRSLELTRRGATVEEDALRALVGEAAPGAAYLRNLSRREVRAALLHNHGFVALQQGRREAARADLEAAVRALPGLPEAHRNLGVWLGQGRRWPESIAAFRRALALHPGDLEARINLALSLREDGRGEEALAQVEEVLRRDPARERARKLREEWRGRAAGGGERPAGAVQPGLLGRYFRGTAHEEAVAERVDADLDFEWSGRPAPRVPPDGFSVRWEGWLSLPDAGTWTFFVIANDGVRIAVDGRKVLEDWEERGRDSFMGSAEAELGAGWHRLRVEFFDSGGPSRLWIRLGREGAARPLPLAAHLFH